MTFHSLLRMSTVVAFGLLLALPVSAQTGYGNIGPSKGQVAGAVVGIVLVITGVGILVYYGTHKHALIAGCVNSDQQTLTLRNEKDHNTYILAGDSSAVRPGQKVSLRGKKVKDSAGKLTFQVQKVMKDYGECTPI